MGGRERERVRKAVESWTWRVRERREEERREEGSAVGGGGEP